MEQDELLEYAARALDQLQVPYFVTGSFAGSLYGEFRMTNDIDVVVDLKKDQVGDLLRIFPPDAYYLDREAALDALRTGFQFNVIHLESLLKMVFIIGGRTSRGREEFQRTRRLRGVRAYDIAYVSPEDLILNKLAMHKESASEKHLRDVVGILKKSGSELDMTYLENWTDWLDVLKSWRTAQSMAHPVP